MSETRSADGMMIAMDDLEAVARMGTGAGQATPPLPPVQSRAEGPSRRGRPLRLVLTV
jgi:hypothetical protein